MEVPHRSTRPVQWELCSCILPGPWPLAEALVCAHDLSSISSNESPAVPRSQSTCCPLFTDRFPSVPLWMKNKLGEDKARETLLWLMQQNHVVVSSRLSGQLHYWWLFPEELYSNRFQPAGLDPWVTVTDHRSPMFCKSFAQEMQLFFTAEASACLLYQISNFFPLTVQ